MNKKKLPVGNEMTAMIRSLLGNALKGNEALLFTVLTGCLRISKENIFTGLNNLKVYTVTDFRFDQYFGFTEPEVDAMLEYYGLYDRKNVILKRDDSYLRQEGMERIRKYGIAFYRKSCKVRMGQEG